MPYPSRFRTLAQLVRDCFPLVEERALKGRCSSCRCLPQDNRKRANLDAGTLEIGAGCLVVPALDRRVAVVGALDALKEGFESVN